MKELQEEENKDEGPERCETESAEELRLTYRHAIVGCGGTAYLDIFQILAAQFVTRDDKQR